MRDVKAEDTIFIVFTTRAFATGIPTVLAGTPVVSAYEDAGLTQITAGITLGVDHDSVVGLNMLTIVATAANGYDTGKDYNVVITTGTVGGVSVVGEVVGKFSIDRSPAAQDLANGTDGLGAIKADTAAILTDTIGLNGDAMRGTDSAALAADLLDKLGAVNEAAAAGDPSATESVMQYVKQIVNILAGTAGVVAFPAEAAPGNGVSLAEVIRAMHADVTGIAGAAMRGTDSVDTSAMRGTDSAALASVCTEARLAELAAANLPTDIAAVKTETALIVADTNELQTDNVPGLIAALNDIATSDVLTQVNAALDTAIAELGVAIPTATPTIRTALMLQYMALRNKLVVQTSATDALELYNDAGTLITKKLLTDDGSDYTEAEMS